MVKIYYIYGESDYYIYGQIVITFMVSHLLHLWLIFITFMVSITFMGDTDTRRRGEKLNATSLVSRATTYIFLHSLSLIYSM